MMDVRAWMPYRRLIDPGFIGRAIESYRRENGLHGDDRIVAACFGRLLVGSATKWALRYTPVDESVDASTMVDSLEVAVDDAAPTNHVRMSSSGVRRCDLADIDLRRTHAFRESIIESLSESLRTRAKVSKQLLVSESAVAWYAVLRTEIGPGHECVRMLTEHWSGVARISDVFWEHTVHDASGRALPFLIRKACCLEYKLQVNPRYCATCPLIDPRDAVAWQEDRLRTGGPSRPGGQHARGRGATSSAFGDGGSVALRGGKGGGRGYAW